MVMVKGEKTQFTFPEVIPADVSAQLRDYRYKEWLQKREESRWDRELKTNHRLTEWIDDDENAGL